MPCWERPTRLTGPGCRRCHGLHCCGRVIGGQTPLPRSYLDKVSPAAFELLEAMFQYDPDKRPTAAEALEHPYFKTEEPAISASSRVSFFFLFFFFTFPLLGLDANGDDE